MLNKLDSAFRLIRASASDTPYLVLYVTNKCDLNCPFCFNRETRLHAEEAVSAMEFQTLARSVHSPFEILISGGEPFLRNDLGDILAGFIRYSNPAVITIPTNGSQTGHIGKVLEIIQSLNYKGRLHINLSIDGPGEEHDRIRGSRDLHRKIRETAAVIRSHQSNNRSIWLGVISVAGDHNETLIEPLIEWVRDNIAPDIHDIGLERGYIDRNDPVDIIEKYRSIRKKLQAINPPAESLEDRVYSALMTYFDESVRAGRPADGCRAGKTITVVTADGKVYPCEPFWISPEMFPMFENTCLGDLRNHDWNLPALLKTPAARRIMTKIRNGECRCFWECALFANLLFTHKGWIRIGSAILRRH